MSAARELKLSSVDEIRLTLFISSLSPTTPTTLDGLVRICRDIGSDRCRLEIVDVDVHPEIAELHRVVATPTLIRDDARLKSRIVGDLSDREQLANQILPELFDHLPDATHSNRVIGRITCA